MSIYSPSDFIREVKAKPEHFVVVHYSCQSLYDDNEDLSPRITSIAVEYFANEQVVSLSTHALAEELGICRDKVPERLDEVEKLLLERFYAFVREHRDLYWVHWNMRNLTFGFEHLEHRFRILHRSDPPSIPVERRLNLNDLLAMRYGKSYANDPKLQDLMELNGGVHRHFLTGKDEVEAFKKNEFIRMHNSTLCKVGFMQSVMRKMTTGRLRTRSKGWGQMLDNLLDSRWAKVVALLSAAAGLLAILWQIG
jgi:hypothetical protein